MNARKPLAVYLGLAFLLIALAAPAAAQAGFGIKSLSVSATNGDGAIDTQAGSHPYEYTVGFELNQDSEGNPEGRLRDLVAELPPGLVGNPFAVPHCKQVDFEGGTPQCPADTQIGIAHVGIAGVSTATLPVYNLVPPLGAPFTAAFSIIDINSFQEASLRSGGDYGVNVSDVTIPTGLAIQSVTETIWGVPAAAGHDSERGEEALNGGPPLASDVPLTPFLSLPTSCTGPLKTTLNVDSLQNPGAFDTKSVLSADEEGTPFGLDGCNKLEFNPSISSQPTTNLADSPSGLDFNLHVPQPQVVEVGPGRSESCSTGSWEGEPSEFAFQWLRNGVPIEGANSFSYVIAPTDATASLQCEVTATNFAVGPGHAVSAPLVVPPAPASAPPKATTPFITVSEETATCEPGPWEGEPSFSFQWLKDGVPVPGGTEQTYEIAPGEAPLTLQCEVSGTNAGGTVVAFSANKASEPPLEPALPEATEVPGVSFDESNVPLASAAFKDTRVTLPAGVTLNPSAGNGLGSCDEQQIGYQPSEGKIHFSEDPQSCPDAAKVGTLEVSSPLLDHKLSGGVYVAKPYQNPFGSLLAIYLVVEDEQTGIVAKLAGEVTPDSQTGQLTATFTENPQLPIEDVDLHFFEGPRAALKTPLTCGQYTTTSTLVPWSTPEGADATPSDSFETSVAAGGSGICPSSEAGAPNKPAFSAGTIAPQAGAYSPFLLKLSREDGSQRLTGIDTTLPKGLTGKLAGIPYCSDAQIAAAKAREAPNQGANEQQSPSCPLSSEVGSVTVGAGAGITPLYVTGHAYLAGPYKGAPLSLVIITPAVAGPFDLGAVVVRTALYVNPETAQIHAVSDPLPSIIQGIPLDLRSVSLRLDRPSFTLNPTSCDPAQITGSAAMLTGQSSALVSPFQVGGCNALGFKPKLALSLKGGTKRNRYPALKAVVTYPNGGAYANIARAQVTLPHSEFLEQGHIGTICTRVQFAANACPARSIYGKARAFTPLLDKPLEGPVYLRSSSRELPDLVAALRGQVDVDLVGKVDTGQNDGIRNTFEAAPDAPVSKFVLEMQGGKKGLLVNSENICRKAQKASASFTAHNGKTYEAKPLIKNDCGKKGRKGKKHKRGGKGHK